jgi:hypothetical protein
MVERMPLLDRNTVSSCNLSGRRANFKLWQDGNAFRGGGRGLVFEPSPRLSSPPGQPVRHGLSAVGAFMFGDNKRSLRAGNCCDKSCSLIACRAGRVSRTASRLRFVLPLFETVRVDDARTEVNRARRGDHILPGADMPLTRVHFADTHDTVGPADVIKGGNVGLWIPLAARLGNAAGCATERPFLGTRLRVDRLQRDRGEAARGTPLRHDLKRPGRKMTR